MNPIKFELPARYRLRQYPPEPNEWVIAFGQVFEGLFGKPWNPKAFDARVLRALLLYFSGNENELFPLNKGVMLWGGMGTGKSVVMETLKTLTLVLWRPNWWRAYDAATIALVNNEATLNSYLNFADCAYYDDVGSELTTVKMYGTDLHPMLEILTQRYNRWQRSGVFTHITSNVGIDELGEIYGYRIGTRIFEMCTAVEIKGKNLRLTNN